MIDEGCHIKGPHGEHEIILQFIDVGVGGKGIPEYGLCPGEVAPSDGELRAREAEQAELDALAGRAQDDEERRAILQEQADADRDREEEAGRGGPEGNPDDPG